MKARHWFLSLPLLFAISALAAAELKLLPEPAVSVPAEPPAFEGIDEELFRAVKGIFLLPVGAQTPEVATTVKCVRTPKHLYVLFECDEPEMGKLPPPRFLSHDASGIERGNGIELRLLPAKNAKLLRLAADASGNLLDAAGDDRAWESHAVVKRERNEDNYRLELVLPLSALPGWNGKALPVNFIRRRTAPGAKISTYQWNPPNRKQLAKPKEFGVLHFEKQPLNLIQNGDFSKLLRGRPRHWSGQTPGGSWVWPDSWNFIRGGRSCRMSTNARRNRKGVVLGQKISGIKPATRYRLSFFVRTGHVTPIGKTKGGAAVELEIGKWSFCSDLFTGTHPWRLYGYEFTTPKHPPDGAEAQLQLKFLSAGGSVFFDDLRLTPAAARREAQ